MKHPHADLMLQYAQDAMTTDKPWTLWEHDGYGKWQPMTHNPNWHADYNYRRKADTPDVTVRSDSND